MRDATGLLAASFTTTAFLLCLLLLVGLTGGEASLLPAAPDAPAIRRPPTPQLTAPFPGYQDYQTIQWQLGRWASEAVNLAHLGSYGSSTNGKPLCFLRVTNLLDARPKPKVLITACIHGNEPLSTSTTMGFVGSLLSRYGAEAAETAILDERDLYFVPVVCPDSYPSSRQCDGVDPNRDFPGPSRAEHRSIAPLAALQAFFKQQRFAAAISGHTHGRVYLSPYGDRDDACPNDADYLRILGRMKNTSQYRIIHASQMYGHPIHGSEVDWYYRQGAFSIVCEYGTHQRIPSLADVQEEFRRTYAATLLFLSEAPAVRVVPERYARFMRAAPVLERRR